MSSPTPEDELLVILLRNLHNAAATFGEGSRPYKDILSTVHEHLQDMKRKGVTTNIAQARALLGSIGGEKNQMPTRDVAGSNPFGSLAFRPRPKS